jgi:phosphoserine phosphatase RsbU/P
MHTLIKRILSLDAPAYQEFALLFGPLLLDHMLRKGLPLPEAERLAVDSLNSSLGRLDRYRPDSGPFPEWLLAHADTRYQAWLHRLCGLERDLEAAANTQTAWMPPIRPEVQGLEVCFLHRPLRLVTGDFCELLAPRADRILIAMGDASGKGASAAVYGTLAGSCLRAFAQPDASPMELLGRLDAALKEFPAGSQYATLLLACWHPELREFEFCNGGSPPPILLRDGEISQVTVNGSPLGLPTPAEFEQVDLPVFRGDLLVLYSDGIPDQPGPDGSAFGDARFAEIIREMGQETVEQIARSLLADLERFRGGLEEHDDQMVLVMRVT